MANITVTPQGNIYLCKTKLESDYKNQLTFTNKENQETYFNSKIITTFDNYTYIKNQRMNQKSAFLFTPSSKLPLRAGRIAAALAHPGRRAASDCCRAYSPRNFEPQVQVH